MSTPDPTLLDPTEARPIHPLPLVFDLVTSLLVPHIRRRLPRVMWPVTRLPISQANTDASPASRRTRVFKQGIDKVAGTLQDIHRHWQQPGSPFAVNLLEYFMEVTFQRFFAWAVWRAERWSRGLEEENDQNERVELRKDRFKYRNGAANARAVLAMPLLCDLYHEMQVYIQQGNFGYMAAKNRGDQLWIYPHLDHYLANVYHPWIPLKTVQLEEQYATRPAWERALRRCLCRSQMVAGEMWEVLRGGKHLWQTPASDRLTYSAVENLFAVGQTRSVSPFVQHAVMSPRLGLGTLWTGAGPKQPIDEIFRRLSQRVPDRVTFQGERLTLAPVQDVWGGDVYATLPDDRPPRDRTTHAALVWRAQLAQELLILWDDTADRIGPWISAFLADRGRLLGEHVRETDLHLGEASGQATEALNTFASSIALDPNQPNESGVKSLFCQFLRWRAVEEGLRLLADRLFLYRRYADPQVTRPAELSRFHDRGMVVALEPEIHLNLCFDDQLDQPCMPIDCAWPGTRYAGACSSQEPGKKQKCRTVPPEGESPAARLAREKRELECAAWIKEAQDDYRNQTQLSQFWMDGRYPCHALFETLLIGDETLHSASDFLMARTLSFLVTAPDESGPAAVLAQTANQAARFFTWVRTTHPDFAKSPLVGVEGRMRWWGYDPTNAAEGLPEPPVASPRVGLNGWRWLWNALKVMFGVNHPSELARLTLDDLQKAHWPALRNEEELDRWGRHFFALASFRSVNLAIFRTLGAFGASESLINVRLLAPERGDGDAKTEDLQDFADFIGSFAYRDPAPLAKTPATDESVVRGSWRQSVAETWLPDLIRLKVLVRILGTSLLNMVRTREWRKLGRDEEQDRLRDLVRTLLHGYQKTASNFPQMIRDVTEIDDPDERKSWGRFVRHVVAGHSARMVSVNAASRGLMERRNPEGLLRRCEGSVTPPKKSGSWCLFLNIVAHGCLLGYVSRLAASGVGEKGRQRISTQELEWLIRWLDRTEFDSEHRTSAEYKAVFERMKQKDGFCKLPAVNITGNLNTAGNCWCVIPDGVEPYVGNCWALVFAELMDDMLKAETATSRSIHLHFNPEAGTVETIWSTGGVKSEGIGSLRNFIETKSAAKWHPPVRPRDEASSGWGHFGNHMFVVDVMRIQTEPLPTESDEFQRYDLRWDNAASAQNCYDLDTRIVLTSPSISYGQ